jgi:hypothetical protein
MKTRIDAGPVTGLALSCYSKSLIKELKRTSVSLFLISYLKGLRKFQKRLKSPALAHDKVAKMRRKCRNEMQGVETLCKNLIESHQRLRIISLKEGIHKRETVLIIKHIEIAEHILVLDVGTAESHGLVKDGQGVTHGTVGLMCNHMERLVVDGHVLAGSDHAEVLHYVIDRDPVEVICLAT